MPTLQDIEVFVGAVEAGSLSAAARLLDLTPAVASAALKRMEAELGVALFVRSTRSLRLTREGERFLPHCRMALQALAAGREELASAREEVGGTLQLAVPSDLGRSVLLPWLDEFLAHHPALSLRIHISDRMADVYRQPVDIALRYGVPPDSSLVALPIALSNSRVLCASPAYLARRGTPTDPRELGEHECLCYMLSDEVYDRWRFSRDGSFVTVAVRSRRVADDGELVRRWALAGQGIAYKSALDVWGDITAGRLVHVCPEWIGEHAPLYLVSPDRRQLSPVVQTLRLFLQSRCEALLGLRGVEIKNR